MFRPRLIGWLLVLVTLLAYLPILRNGFLNFDDTDYVTENLVVQQGLTWPGLQWAFQTWHSSNWHPLTWLSHMADCEVFRLNPAGHHLVNLLWHAANVWLLFLLWRRLTGTLWPSAMIAALFAWHPLHVESVAWVAERKDVLSTCFALLALLNYVRWVKSPARTDLSTPPPCRSGTYWLALTFFALGLMSKPMLVTLPCVMLLLDFWPLQRMRQVDLHASTGARLKRLAVEKWPFFVLTLASCAVTILAQRAEAIAPLTKYSFGLRLENVVTAYAAYLFKTFWPAHLAVFYPLLQPDWTTVALAAAVLLAISGWVWWRAQSQPWLAVGWLWYLGTLVPVIGLLQVGDQALADRYTYFPLIGIFFAATWAARDFAHHFRLANWWLAVAAALVLAACLAVTELQLRYWQSSETLFTRALAVTADNAPARLNLGEAFQAEHRPAEALAEYRQALKLDPACYQVYNNLGRLLNDEGKPAEALEYCRTAVALYPNSPPSHNGLGMVLAELGHFDEALGEFSAASRLDPHYAAPLFQTGRVLLKLGRDAEALPRFQEALRREPGNLGMLIFIARVLASDPHPQGRNGSEALALAQRAAQLAGVQQPVVLDTLAMACAETGHFDEATKLARQAIAAALAAGSREDATNMQQRLELYQLQQPARISCQSEVIR
jgi:tetratricopeptide (TPR) repeat protein